MSLDATAERPQRPRSATSLRMTTEQTRQLAALKARRAARISQEAAAAKRRLVTVGASAVLVLAALILVGVGVLNPWWIAPAGALFAGSLAASWIAGSRIAADREREELQFAVLQEQIDRRRPRMLRPVTQSASPRPVASEAVAAVSVPEAPEEAMAEEPAATPEESLTVQVAVEDDAATAAEGAWEVTPLPAPAPVRKARVTRRAVHVDTDLVSVAPVVASVPRPARAGAGLTAAAALPREERDGFTFDLDEVLEARRAQ